MRQLTKRLTCSGFFSGLIITASSGICQESFRFPTNSQRPIPVARQVAWDQIPSVPTKPVAHSKMVPGAFSKLIGPSDLGPALKAKRATALQLPWDVVVAPNVPGHSTQGQQALQGETLGYQNQETAGLIGPADFEPTRIGHVNNDMPMPKTPWKAPATAVVAPPKSSNVSLLPMTAAKQPALPAAQSVPTAPIAPAAPIAEPPSQSSPSDRPAEQQTYVLQSVRAPEKKETPPHETLIPIDILPFNRLASANTPMAADAKYSTAEMTGPLTDASMLFSQLHISEDYRNIPAVALSPVRTVADASGFGPEWMYQSYAWVSPSFYHKPLYFEQVNLERYGIGPKRHLQPFYSAAHFYFSLGLMPYKMLTQHPCEHVYTLGNNRPGDCVPFQKRSLLGQSYPFEAFKYFHSSCYR